MARGHTRKFRERWWIGDTVDVTLWSSGGVTHTLEAESVLTGRILARETARHSDAKRVLTLRAPDLLLYWEERFAEMESKTKETDR